MMDVSMNPMLTAKISNLVLPVMMVCNSPQFHQCAYHTNAKRAIFDLITSDIPFKKNSNFMCVFTLHTCSCVGCTMNTYSHTRWPSKTSFFKRILYESAWGYTHIEHTLSLYVFHKCVRVFMCECVMLRYWCCMGFQSTNFQKNTHVEQHSMS